MAELKIFIGYLGLTPQYHIIKIPEQSICILPLDAKLSKHIQDHISMRKYLVKSMKRIVGIPQKKFSQKIHKSERI